MQELRRFFAQRWQELLITGIWLQSAVAAAFTGNVWAIVLTSLGGLILLFATFSVIGWLQRRTRFGNGKLLAMPRKAIVFTVGYQKNTILWAIDAQKPEWLGLLCSRETESVANEIAGESGVATDHIQKEIADATSVEDIRSKMATILDWLKRNAVARPDTIVDITAGTAVMSVGTFSMANERSYDCQYLRSQFDINNKPIKGTQEPVVIVAHTTQTDPGSPG